MTKLYRVTSNGKGIYERVDELCPKDDSRRRSKPDGSWVAKAGLAYPGSKSYWTEKGFKKYKESGLFNWHRSVVGEVQEEEIDKPQNVLYEDELQVLVGGE